MGDQISIEVGRMPWQPADDAVLAETLHYYDAPLIGVIEQCGMKHVFWCLEGHVDPTSLWAYTRVDEAELAPLRGSSDFDAALAQLTADRPIVIALFREGDGIVWTEYVEQPRQFKDVLEAAVATAQSIESDLRDLRSAG